jgi:hypothetical protein
LIGWNSSAPRPIFAMDADGAKRFFNSINTSTEHLSAPKPSCQKPSSYPTRDHRGRKVG